MMSRMFGVLSLGVVMALSANADSADQTATGAEALAWTVAAYSSCETHEELAVDFREEVARQESSVVDVLAAMRILQGADNVCELKQTFAADMLSLSMSDMSKFEAILMWSETPAEPVFELEEPKGGSQTAALSIIAHDSTEIPPTSSSLPQSSDYVE